jgi:hypothetical protein
VPGARFGPGVITMSNDVEFETHWWRRAAGFFRLGGAMYHVSNPSTLNVDFANVSFGIRYNLTFFFMGIGLEYAWLRFNNALSEPVANASMVGPTVEIGKAMAIGPVRIGGSVGAKFARNNVWFKQSSPGDLGDFQLGNSINYKLECFAGYVF